MPGTVPGRSANQTDRGGFCGAHRLSRETDNKQGVTQLINYSCDEDCEVRKLRRDEKEPLLASSAQGSHPRGIGFLR